MTCHLNDGTGRGPSLAGVFGRKVSLSNGSEVVANDTYIRESILTPQTRTVAGYQALMPTFQGQVNEEGVMSLIEVHQIDTGHGGPGRGATERGA